jgi:tetratricopeptide (TPR) repeat protein
VTSNNSTAHINLGGALLDLDRLAEAEQHFEAAVRIHPHRAKARFNLGLARLRLGRLSEAAEQFTKALELDADYAAAHNGLGLVHYRQERLPEAVAHFRAAVGRAPQVAVYRFNLAAALYDQGPAQRAAAESEYAAALRLDPHWPDAAARRAWQLATAPNLRHREPAEALLLAKQACQATGFRRAELLDVLAAAYAEAGRFEEASAVAQLAIQQALAANETTRARQIEERLRLYQKKEPYRTGRPVVPPVEA